MAKLPRFRHLVLITALIAVPTVASAAQVASAAPTYREMGPIRNLDVYPTLDRKSIVVTADPVENAAKYVITHNGTKVYEGRNSTYTDTNRGLGVGTHVYSMIAISASGKKTAPNVVSYIVKPYATVLPPIQNSRIGSILVDISDQRIYVYGDRAIFPPLLAIIMMSSGRDNSTPIGTFKVFSRSEHSFFTGSYEQMDHMVRFTKGRNGGNIGFHSIPYHFVNGVKTYYDTPLGIAPSSHGCVRLNDYAAAWVYNNIPDGATVRVVA